MASVEGPIRTRSLPRPRSPIPRIKQFFTLGSPTSRSQLTTPRYVIPTEVIKRVGYHTSSLRDVLSISLTVSEPMEHGAHLTNRPIVSKGPHGAFARCPKLACHIRALTVRPNNVERTPSGDYLDEDLVAGLVAMMASRMLHLRLFYWDGLEMPKDKLWLALRQFCPLLKSVGTSVGGLPIRNADALFDFRDLVSFTLSVKSDSLDWLLDGGPTIEKLPRRCWQMLLENCPNLQDLAIGGSAPSPRIFDTRHVTAGRWPRLRKLTLGDMQLQSPSDHNGKGKSAFTTMPYLLSLTIWIDLSFSNRKTIHDDGDIFRAVLDCCPSLLHFEVFCFTRPSFHIKEFSAALRQSPRLRSFSLTKVYKSSDEDMGHTALRIAHENPHIQRFSLRYTEESWLTHSSGRVKQFGQYEAISNADGIPTSLLAREWGLKSFGHTYSRRYVQHLESLKGQRSTGSSRSSWASSERARSPRPISVLSFNSFHLSAK
ncbi:hypothetical protein C0991_003520 [Blastosporella zonata]|nr:hypothetical protein C0991_003520 [Blastosporella zonata]